MKTINKITDSTYSVLGNALIFCEGRYWLAEKYDAKLYGGGWFASPIYETENGLEVRPAGGNWCYKLNGAIESKSLNNDQMKQIYQSRINQLNWSYEFTEKKITKITKLKELADYFRALLLSFE